MPIVTLAATEEWTAVHPWNESTHRQKAIKTLMDILPAIVSKALTQLGHATPPKEVMVLPVTIEPEAINAPVLWITVRPMWKQELADDKRILWGSIRAKVYTTLVGELQREDGTELPQFDVDLLFEQGCGGTTDSNGTVINNW